MPFLSMERRLVFGRTTLFLLLACLLAGCALRTPPPEVTLAAASSSLAVESNVVENAEQTLPGIAVESDAAQSPESVTDATAGEALVTLEPGDTITIEVFREAEMSGAFRLNQDGNLRHPVMGSIALGGLTVEQAENHVRQQMGENFLVNPQVILRLDRVERSATWQVLMIGEVRKPGVLSIPAGERLTLLEAIAKSGGFTPKASANRVRVVRNENGKQSTLRVRVASLLAGRGNHRDIALKPDDVITVPEVWF